ncbi:glycosyltransferase family 32 protein [Pseudomonas synxantha]|uniref:Sugar-binding protein n=1 Tax=Pseudomonas synxantha TaxID=47883 RepID=A0ABS0UAB4_9PSED|nr:glycosyltransferase [Pseudomonas synxantha]MBI6562521.1 sugar-binding protein [Pseudomonas synxantha]MBI6583853.1 sugar-binding protein [Pseudomonas synxantha]MBI6643746.1 sugar-binding protein [Pseudomonas synxantha]
MNNLNPVLTHLPATALIGHDSPSAATVLTGVPSKPLDNRPDASANDPSPDEFDNPAALKKAFAEYCNWKELAAKLLPLLEELTGAFPGDLSSAQQSRLEKQLAAQLNSLSLPVCELSSYYEKHNLTPTSVIKLHTFLSGSGLNVPKTLDELLALYQRAIEHVHTHPLGNFSGALSWPTPLATQDKQTIIDLLNAPGSTVPGLPLADKQKGVLGYLLSAANLSNDDFKYPSSAMETLLGSAKAQALGQAIQTQLGGIATDTSSNDYLLAAIHLGLDPESLGTPARNSVAGFDLGQRQYWNKPAALVIDGLSRYLVAEGRATPQSADLAARMLLARVAPEYRVKDIPANVTYGSIPWTQLAIAATKLEAKFPGRVLTMSYSQVLAAAEAIDVGAPLTHRIQHKALSNWGVVHGLLRAGDIAPTQIEMQAVQNAFNAQQSALQATSTALATSIPSRETMALELLRAEFPGVPDSVFKARNILKASLTPGRPTRFPGNHSMLDIVMQGDKVKHDDKEHWLTQDKRIPINEFCEKFASGKLTVADTFTERYNQAITELEKGHTGLTQYLISNLPPEDKQNFEYGQLEFFHTNEYKIGTDFGTKTLTKRGHTLDVKTTRDGQVNIYRIDTSAGTVSKHNYLIEKYSPPYGMLDRRDANRLYRTVQFNPFEDEHAKQSTEKATVSQTPQVFNSERTNYIAKVFAKSLDLHNDDLLEHASGTTSYDKSAAADDAIGNFFLNLIPFRSAIVNFMKGDVGEGLFDLGLDVVGLVTLGVGKAAQAGKVLAKGVTSLKAASKTVRFLGGAALEALNPLGGAGDLLKGASRLVWSKGKSAVNFLRGASGSYDVLKEAGKQHAVVAVGTYKLLDHAEETGAALRNGNWYDYDVAKGQPYGKPLKDFRPSVVAAADELKVLNPPALRDYAVDISPDRLQVKGLQSNIYKDHNGKEFIKIDHRFYQSKLKDGQRVIQHPNAGHPDLAIRDLGGRGWELSATANRLLGGESLPAWKLNENTYIVPVDDINIQTGSPYPYVINYQGMNYATTFDTKVGAWSAGVGNTKGTMPEYFWRSAKNKWQRGSLENYQNAKKIADHNFRFIEAPAPAILQMPRNIRPIPQDIHYFWAGGEIPDRLTKNIAANTDKMPGFKSIVHIDADTPELFQAIKLKLAKDAPGVTAMNLHEEEFFQPLKNTELYSYFRKGQGKNLAATSDVARYPLMNKYGGIYLDTDDAIKGAVGSAGLNAGDSDILVSRPVAHKVTDYKPFFNTSNFATHPNNPVIAEMITEMNHRFTKNKAYFEANRPTITKNSKGGFDYTSDFLEYEGKVFETVGPNMFDDVLKSKRPDIYDAGFDGMSKEKMQQGNHGLTPGKPFNIEDDTRQYYASKGLTEPDGLKQSVQEAKKHYRAYRDQLQISVGAEHSWINS